ncbi:hypothetical protein SFB1_288G2 [Candidatus Arthromitus sp. SFB-1]|nr:hypothetical protein SFB1_288G2 [Candidatus Arthromitus sp. SFB-1]
MCPKTYGSSTIGVKKSKVDIIPKSSPNLYTAASSLFSNPTIKFLSLKTGNLSKIFERTSGSILAPHPEV